MGVTPPNIDKLIEISLHRKESEKQQRMGLKTVLNKYIKSNVKLTVPLDLNHSVDLIKLFVDCSLQRISIRFTNLKELMHQALFFQSNFEAFQS